MIKVKDLIFKNKRYDENEKEFQEDIVLNGINIDIKQGMFVGILGHNGSGKSTFARHLNALLMPDDGEVYIDGNNTKDIDKIYEIRKACGMVFQNPDNQIIGMTVEEDVAFGPENLGLEINDIKNRVDVAIDTVAMTEFKKRSPNRLSGGQKQRVAIASALAMKPKCIVLDEPTAMLDPYGRKEVMQAIKHLNKSEGIGVILITHHMDEVVNADYIFVLDKGELKLQGKPREVFTHIDELYEYKLSVPYVTRISNELMKLGMFNRCDIFREDEFIQECKERELLNDNYITQIINKIGYDKVNALENNKHDSWGKADVLELQEVSCIYEKGTNMQVFALDNVSFKVKKGEFISVIGHTGSGKSTLLQVMNGLIKPDSGKVFLNAVDINGGDIKKKDVHLQVGLTFQYPEYQLFENTVLEDVCFGPRNKGYDEKNCEKLAKESLGWLGITKEFYNKSPFQLSGGEKRRVAIAGVIAMNPEILILDEPTAGLDPYSAEQLLKAVKRLRDEKGITIIMVSHNMEEVDMYSDRIIVMNNGKILIDDSKEKVFSNSDELVKIGVDIPYRVKLINRLQNINL